MGLLDYLAPKAKKVGGLLEIAGQMGTGAAAQLGGGLAYLPAAAIGGDKAGQAVMSAVNDAYTYQPRSDYANGLLNKVGAVMAPIAKSGSVGAQKFADNVYGATGSPLLGAVARAAPTAIDLLVDRLRIGKMGGPKKQDITAYHGTPHDFDQFDTSRIGSGEGAQSYGHGLYFADDPAVANQYKAQLGSVEIDGNKYVPSNYDISALIARHEGDSKGLSNALRKYANNGKDNPYSGAAEAESLASILDSGSVIKTKGKMYTVDIPDEHVAKMLDWDKPIGEQTVISSAFPPSQVRKIIKDWEKKRGEKWGDQNFYGMSGAELHGTLADIYGSKQASDFLSGAGIPGIRFFDQGSRGAGQGTKNTVLFDDKLVKVLKKE